MIEPGSTVIRDGVNGAIIDTFSTVGLSLTGEQYEGVWVSWAGNFLEIGLLHFITYITISVDFYCV